MIKINVEDGKKVINQILVEFRYYDQKLKIMQQKKKTGRSKNFNGVGNDIDMVYINENLTLFGKELLHHAKKFKKTYSWKFTWTRSGKIHLRKK